MEQVRKKTFLEVNAEMIPTKDKAIHVRGVSAVELLSTASMASDRPAIGRRSGCLSSHVCNLFLFKMGGTRPLLFLSRGLVGVAAAWHWRYGECWGMLS